MLLSALLHTAGIITFSQVTVIMFVAYVLQREEGMYDNGANSQFLDKSWALLVSFSMSSRSIDLFPLRN